VLPATTAAPGGDAQVRVLARWRGPGTAPRTGEVLATSGSPAGSAVTVWLDASGKLAGPPLQPGQITDRIIVVAVLAPTVLALSLLTALRLAERLADRRRLAAWDAAWSRVGPQWTRRRPLTGADDAANTSKPDQPPATPRPVRNRPRRVLRRPRPDLWLAFIHPRASRQ
jgi:hypothetical protein